MDIDEEFDALGLPNVKQGLAWEARAKVTWGDPGEEVQTWLVANGIDPYTADHIVAIALRERAIAFRVNGVRDLILGTLIGVGGAGVGLGVVLFIQTGLVHVAARGMALLVAFSFLAFMYGLHLTWRGLFRIISGARTKGAVSDIED
jgi:hypothetical protein